MIVANTEILTKKRIVSGMRKAELARKIGVASTVIVRAEQGRGVSPKTAKLLCEELGTDFDDLFTITEKGGADNARRQNAIPVSGS